MVDQGTYDYGRQMTGAGSASPTPACARERRIPPSPSFTSVFCGAYFPPGGAYSLSQAKISSCQRLLFCGLRTQCPSSGKLTKRDGTPCRCSAVKSSCP